MLNPSLDYNGIHTHAYLQMTVQNLAVCFAPTLFALSNPMPKASASLARRGSFKRTAVVQGLSPSQMATSKGVNDSVVSIS